MARVFVDTNVLFPFSLMDLNLALTEDGVHELLWTDFLLAEWERVIVREQKRSSESAAKIVSAIREFFPEGRVAEEAYVHLVAELASLDPDDRHHMAAAVAGNASVIVTWNRADFPADVLARRGVRVLDPDEYLCELIVELPNEVVDTVIRLAGEKRRPPLTAYDLAAKFAEAGARNFAVRLIDLLDAEQVADAKRIESESAGSEIRAAMPLVPASEVAAYLTANRPPVCTDIEIMIPRHQTVGKAAHATVIKAVLLEMLTIWPEGTTLVIDYGEDAHLQALAYPPRILTEIGRLDPSRMPDAVRFGWMDPTVVRARHDDFDSQPVWIDNPVREWTHPNDPPQEIASFLAGSVRAVLGREPGDGYVLRLFNFKI
jgi:predicted nucleic acid-binding protein